MYLELLCSQAILDGPFVLCCAYALTHVIEQDKKRGYFLFHALFQTTIVCFWSIFHSHTLDGSRLAFHAFFACGP
jgi:hypothetical protein